MNILKNKKGASSTELIIFFVFVFSVATIFYIAFDYTIKYVDKASSIDLKLDENPKVLNCNDLKINN